MSKDDEPYRRARQAVSGNSEQLVPGVRRLRPDDHFMVLLETDTNPMHIGALLLLDVPADVSDAGDRLRAHLLSRLPETPLLTVLRQAPEGYDSDVWAVTDSLDEGRHLRLVHDRLSAEGLRSHVASAGTRRLDLDHPPFEIEIFDNLEAGGAALYLKMHHAVADGIGFQSILGLLSDEAGAEVWPESAAELPSADEWRALADARFTAEADRSEQHRLRRKEASVAIKALEADPQTQRATTPQFALSGPTSAQRAYATTSLPLSRIKSIGAALGGTVNDIFLAVAATALREALMAMGQLPGEPIVINSARSYRRAQEHGLFGNRIVAIHPHLATTIDDPLDRLRAIQASMASEMRRTPLDEAMLDQPEKPFGARDRRAAFAQRTSGGAAVLPGNITLSNVPGPAEARFFGGLRQRANHPVPLLGSGRFLNITSRRNGGMIDFGIMADPTKFPDVTGMAVRLSSALTLYEALAGGEH